MGDGIEAERWGQKDGKILIQDILQEAACLVMDIDSINMALRKTITGDCHELLVSGRIDAAGANELELEVLATIRGGANPIYVNLSEATFLCSAGIRVLMQYWRQMKNSQRTLLVTRPAPEVESVLETTGFKDLIV